MILQDLEKIKKSFINFKDNIFDEKKIVQIEKILIEISNDEKVSTEIKNAKYFGNELKSAAEDNNIEKREELLTDLYLLLHRYGAGYSSNEKKFMERSRGLKWLPGGLMPLVLGSYLMRSDFEFCDLGCGNGLQGFLMQALCPHKKTRQVEISESYLKSGNIFLNPLKIDKKKTSFENTDIKDFEMNDTDFVYMYRPARPMGEGAVLYKNLADKFFLNKKNFYLLSVADCFEPFIKGKYEKIYQNEFLSIFYFEK